ncbi:MAG: hypothetical protein AAF467_14385 [Actinomycetota bacterium]
MSVSRDEARELAIIGALVALTLRVSAGVVQAIEEATGNFTIDSLAARFFAPVSSTIGILALGAVMIVVLSPTGSVTPGLVTLTRRAAGVVMVLGLAATFHTIAFGTPSILTSIWITLINGAAAATLGGTGWWVLRHFDPER